MSSILSILKIKMSADTSELKKGAQEGKQAVNDMTKEAGSNLSSFADLFGINMGEMGKQASAFKTTVSGMKAGFKGASEGSGLLSKSLTILKGAIIATGIGALLIALVSLTAYFTSTGEGADKLNQIMAGIGAVIRVITDQFATLGKIIIDAFSNPKETIKNLWEFIKSNFVNRITAIPQLIQAAWNIVKSIFTDASMKDAAADMAASLTQLSTGLDKTQQTAVVGYFKKVGSEMASEAKAAYNLQGALEDLEDQERQMGVTASEREKQIKRLRLISTDETKDAKDRLAANKKAMDLELANMRDENKLASDRVNILKQKLALKKDPTDDELDELAEAQRRVNELESESLVTQKKLQSEQNNLAEAIQKKTQALIDDRKKQDEYLKTIPTSSTVAVTPELANGEKLKTQYYVDVVPSVDYGTLIPDTKNIFAENTKIIKGQLATATESLNEFAYVSQTVIINLADTINSGLADMTTGIAEAFGNMMAGTGDISDIGSVVLGSLADMLITVGKMAIATGIAVAGIKAALTSLNPAVAIAAGIALVALGTAVKSGLSSAASGGGSSGISSASEPVTSIDTRTSSSTASSQTAAIQVEVTGEFKQRGSDLVAVVAKENNRKTLTT